MAVARLFFGVPLQAQATLALEAVCARLNMQPGWRPLGARNWHITLSFLGEVDGRSINSLIELGERVAQQSEAVSISLDSLQWWPSAERPRLLAAVADQSSALQPLRKLLNSSLRELGIAFDGKPLRAHVTLLRLERGIFVSDLNVPACSANVAADTLALYVSEKNHGEKIYRPLWQSELKPKFPPNPPLIKGGN
ncbi:MAG: thpR [Verrucomicrobiaceae bacterium]|nr:thpR [Verrucomicrobiaceae bacterium]